MEELLEQIKKDTLSITPQSYKKDSSVLPPEITLIKPEVSKPSFSEITPFAENTVYKTLDSGEKVRMFEDFIPGTDNEERLAQQQSSGDKWANGALKFGTKTLSAVVGGTAGLVYGVGSALSNGSFSSLYDNDFSNWLNDLDTKTNYQFSNYYTEQEKQKGLLGQMGTANFWSDKFLGGLSFTVGALASEGIWAWATGGTSLATSMARLAPKLGRFARWGVEGAEDVGQVLNATSKYKRLYMELPDMMNAGTKSKDLALRLGKAGEIGSAVGFMARSAGYEASVEALQFKKEAEEKFYTNFAQLNGREPNAEDIDKFNKDLESRANTVFGANMAILGVSNLAMMGSVLDIKNPIKTGLADFIDRKAFGYGLEKTAEGSFKAIERTGLQKASRFTFNYVAKPALTEGIFEEGGQGLVQKYNSKWLEHSYDPKLAKETFDSIGALSEAIGEQYGTKEGWVENGLGILIGIVGGSVNARSEMKQAEEELNYKKAMANTYQDSSLQQIILPSKIQTASRIKGFALEAKDEALKGNVVKSELAKKSGQLAFINGELVMGSSVDDITNKFSKSMDVMTADQWKEAGIENVQEYKNNALAEINTLAKEWKTNKKYWQYIIGDKLVGEESLTFGAIDGIIGNFGKNASIVEALTWQSTIGENANKIMDDVRVAVSYEVGEEHAKTLDALKAVEEVADINAKQLKLLQNQNTALKTRRTKLTNQIAKLDVLETTDSQKAKRAEVTKALLETEEAINNLNSEANDIADKINTYNANKQGLRQFSNTTLDSNFSGATISAEDILRLDKNIENFQTTLKSLEVSNPQRAKYLNDLLDEYSQAKDIFLKSQATNRLISSKDFKLENIGSYIGGKIAKNKAMNVDSQEWLQEVLNDYANSVTKRLSEEDQQPTEEDVTDEEYKDFVDNGNIKESTLNKIAEKIKKSEKLTQKETAIFTDKTKEVNEIIRKDNTKTKPKSQEQINQEKIDALEAERRQKLAEVEDIVVDTEEIKADIERRRQEELDNLFSQTQASTDKQLNTPVQKLSKEEINRNIETAKQQNKDLIEELEKEFKENTDNKASDEVWDKWDKKSDKLDNNLPQGVSFKITDGKVDLFDNQSYRESNFGGNRVTQVSVTSLHRQTEKFEVGDRIQVQDGVRALPAEVTKVNENGKILEAKTDDGRTIISKGNIVTTAPINDRLKINAKYDAELKALEQSTQTVSTPQTTTKIVPNQAEIDKINKEYDAKINALKPKSQNPLEQYKQRLETLLRTRYKDLISVEDETKPTQEEIQTFKDGKANEELKAKLSRWKLYDASIDEDGVSVADLITWINQANTQIEAEDTKDEIIAEDVEKIKDDLEGTNITDDYTLAQNTNGSATVVKPKDSNKYRLAHIKMQTIVDRLGGSYVVKRNGVEKKISLDKLKPKDIVEIDGMSLTYLSGGQIEINQDDFKVRQQALNLYIYNSGLNWSYKNIYEVKDNEFVKKTSDFSENEVDSKAIYEQKQGDKLTLEIDDIDGWNKTAIGGTKEQLKIYLVDASGRKVSTLKALRDGRVDEGFLAIREEAFKRWEEQSRPDKMKLGIQVETENIFFGSPEITMSSENNSPTNIPITEAGVSQIIATGFIENGQISLNREIQDVSTIFVSKLSKTTDKKIPLIVIKKGAYSIAYPVSMVKTATPQIDLFDGILQSTITPQEKILQINDAIIKENIKTERLAFDDINDQEKLDKTRKAFEDKKVFVDAKTLADKNYKIKNLVKDAQINIDLENLDQAISDAKLRISFKNTEIKVTLDSKNNNLSEVETELSDLAYELAKDYATNAGVKYVDSKGDIIEDTTYTNTLDDNQLIKATNQLDKMHNVKVIRQAFSDKLPKALEKAIGIDKIRQAQSLIKQYDFLKKQIVVSEEELKEGLNNTDCK